MLLRVYDAAVVERASSSKYRSLRCFDYLSRKYELYKDQGSVSKSPMLNGVHTAWPTDFFFFFTFTGEDVPPCSNPSKMSPKTPNCIVHISILSTSLTPVVMTPPSRPF